MTPSMCQEKRALKLVLCGISDDILKETLGGAMTILDWCRVATGHPAQVVGARSNVQSMTTPTHVCEERTARSASTASEQCP